MPDTYPDFADPQVEFEWLLGLTPSKRTAEHKSREHALRLQLLAATEADLRQQYDMDAVRRLPPDHEACYALLQQAADFRLPEDPALLSSQSSQLYIRLNELRANVDCYSAIAAETFTVLETKVEALRSYWGTICPLEEKFRRDALFGRFAADVLEVLARSRALNDTCKAVHWTLMNHITTIDRVIGRDA